MNGDHIDPLVDCRGNATPLALHLSHAMVGTGLSLVVGKLARTSLGAMLLTFAAGYLMHVTLDAPLAKEIAKADLSARGRLS